MAAIVNRVPAPVAGRFRPGGRLARAVAPVLGWALPAGPTEVVVRSGEAKGLRLVIDPAIEKFYWTGAYEPEVQRALVHLLGPGRVFWDVGAHIGFFTVLASRSIGQGGEVRAFEPLPDNRARLKRALALNGYSSVVVDDRAVADRTGAGILYAAESSLQWSLSADAGAAGIDVECTSLDGAVADARIPDVVKVDAEGAEAAVLRGASGLVAGRATTFIVEAPDGRTRAAVERLLSGLDVRPLGRRHLLAAPCGGRGH